MVDELLDSLNEAQYQAVTSGTGPVLVLAGPGSGKTRVLIHRIAYLIERMQVSPLHIMAVTFTNKAAGEMRHRLEQTLGQQVNRLQIGTFHATCARILRIEADSLPYTTDFTIYDTDDQLAAIKNAMSELSMDPKQLSPRTALHLISSAKNEIQLPADMASGDYLQEKVRRIYERYQIILEDSNAMDFDDLLLQMYLLLRNNPAIRDKYQQRFQYILVDEFQDTNTVQYELVKVLAEPQNNVFAVGDEDQSIYAFRGADFRNVMRFRQNYPQCKLVLLEQNYRSPQPVLDIAQSIIQVNRHRTPKALFTSREGGDKVLIHEAYDEQYEAQFISEQIWHWRRKLGYRYSDFAIMYRTNAQSRALEESFIREGIPYVLVGGVGFYKRMEVRDLLAYLRIVNNPADTVSLQRIINTPRRGIGQKSFQDFQYWAANKGMDYGHALQWLIDGHPTDLSKRVHDLMLDFAIMRQRWVEIAETGKLITLFDTIMKDINYNFHLYGMGETKLQSDERMENLQELRGLLNQADEQGWDLSFFLAEQALVSEVDKVGAGDEAVTLLTLHAAKGLEFPFVFITGVEDKLIPHQNAMLDDNIDEALEEERRLFYVGITRAQNQLVFSYTLNRSQYGNRESRSPSPFLKDIPDHTILEAPAAWRIDRTRQRARDEAHWEKPPLSRIEADIQALKEKNKTHKENKTIRSKIIPFPSAASPETRFKTGMRVSHALFGLGNVLSSQAVDGDEEVTVRFVNSKYGEKVLMASFANLTIVD